MFETEIVVVLIETPTSIILFEPDPVVWLHETEVEPPALFPDLFTSKAMLGAAAVTLALVLLA